MRRFGSTEPARGVGRLTGHSPRSVRRVPARIAAAYETLSCFVRCTGNAIAVELGGRVAVAVAGAGLRVTVSKRGAVSDAVFTRTVSRALFDACGVEAVEMGGAPFTDSGPQLTNSANIANA